MHVVSIGRSHSAELQGSTYLNRQGSLADTTVSKHDQLVQSHFSCHLDWWGWVQARVGEREVAVVRRVRRICGSSISAVGCGWSSVAMRQCKVAGSGESRSSVWTTSGSGRAAGRAATEQQKGLLKLEQIQTDW